MYAQWALPIAMGGFLLLGLYLLLPGRGRSWSEKARLPLDDEPGADSDNLNDDGGEDHA